MGNGATRQPVHGQNALVCDAVPDRSPGPLGWQDAADPDEPMCIAGDTPGPVGTGHDLSCQMSVRTDAPSLAVPVLEVSIEKVSRFFYTVGQAEAQDFYAKRGFGSSEVTIGRPAEVDARARLTAERLMKEFQQVLPNGPKAIRTYLQAQQDEKDKAVESLRGKLSAATKASATQVQILGGIVKVLAVTRFASTLAVKVATLVPGAGRAFDVIDIANDVALEGVDAYFDEGKEVGAVMVESAAKETGKWALEEFTELFAEGLISRNELALIENLFAKYRVDQQELWKQIEKIEQRLARVNEGSKAARSAAKQYVKKIDKLRALRKKAFKGAFKKTAGHAFSLVYFAQDMKQAWGKMSTTWESSN